MNEIPTPAKFRESALIETYFPLLKQIIKLGQAAETILDHRTTYRPFLSEAEQLVRDFPSSAKRATKIKCRHDFAASFIAFRQHN
jgi:hypothetical protein